MKSGKRTQINFEMCKMIKSRGKEIHSEGVCMQGINNVTINWGPSVRVCVCVSIYWTGMWFGVCRCTSG